MLVKNSVMKKQTKRTLVVLGGLGLLYWLKKSKNSTTPPPPPPSDQGAAEAQEIITETQAAVASPYRDATV